ncbi:MAG: hypothetical protein NC420_00980 [Eubacterium sp.]|nr:hypothetical protein [Eubacterium sp.]MCM1213834.1 hypothetical protein [Lachnospiraceae bacterium]MCM1237954.1 hypothetical protein [Lachnospiraceae bacterium]
MRTEKWMPMKVICTYLEMNRDTVMNKVNEESLPAYKNEVVEWIKNNESKNE